jgi:uncharacterized membrane protein YeiH
VTAIDSLPTALIAIMYFGDVVFAFSGALVAARHRMDILGIVLIGVITGIGGGTLRDIILGHPVWWVQNPVELLLCAATGLITRFIGHIPGGRKELAQWADAIGLAAFAVTGAHVAQQAGASFPVVAFMGMLTATGGGVVRDVLTQTRPMILSGELYATAALVGAALYVFLARYVMAVEWAALLVFALALIVRGMAILFHMRMGEPLVTTRPQSNGPSSGEATNDESREI